MLKDGDRIACGVAVELVNGVAVASPVLDGLDFFFREKRDLKPIGSWIWMDSDNARERERERVIWEIWDFVVC